MFGLHWPSWRYHRELPPVIVHCPEDDERLGDGWHHSPVDVPPAPEVPVEPSELDALKAKVAQVSDLVKTQSQSVGDDYNRGMANGLILAEATLLGTEPKFVDAPVLPAPVVVDPPPVVEPTPVEPVPVEPQPEPVPVDPPAEPPVVTPDPAPIETAPPVDVPAEPGPVTTTAKRKGKA